MKFINSLNRLPLVVCACRRVHLRKYRNKLVYETIIFAGTTLCAQYIRSRLKRSGIYHRKLGLKRMRSAKLLAVGTLVVEVYPHLAAVGSELEKMHPSLFEKIGRQIGSGPFNSEQRVTKALTDIAREMLRAGECSWAKVIALYAIAGGMAVDCVRQGKPELLASIQRAMTRVLEEDLAAWIQGNGGWSALAMRYRSEEQEIGWQTNAMILIIATATICICILSVTIRIFLLC